MAQPLRAPYHIPTCLLLVAAGSGCSLFGPPRLSKLAPDARGPWVLDAERMSPRKILAAVQKNDARVRALKCSASVDLRGEERASFTAYVRCERPDKLFVYAKKTLGPSLFRLWVDKQSVSVRVGKTLYQGTVNAESWPPSGRAQAGAVQMLRRSFLGAIDIPDTCKVEKLPSASHDALVLVVLRDGVVWQKFELERCTLLVAERSICDEEGKEVIAIRYRRYKRWDGTWFATEIRASLDAGRVELELGLKKVVLNGPIGPEVFRVGTKDGLELRPLRELGQPSGDAH